jgi:hypothetical protein
MSKNVFTDSNGDHSQQQLSAIKSLQLQLKEANELLEVKEEELELLRKQQDKWRNMKSQLDSKALYEITQRQSIDEARQQAIGAQKREQEMAAELEDTLSIYGMFSQLQERFQYTSIQLEDCLQLVETLKKENSRLAAIAEKNGLLFSSLQILEEENMDLKNRLLDLQSPDSV